MKTPGFVEGVAIALLAAVTGEILFSVLPWFVGTWLANRMIISLLSLSYLIYLLRRAAEKTGRVTLLLLWAVVSLTAAVLETSLPLYLLLQLAFVWLTRSLYFRSGLFGALVDLGLHGLAIVTAIWAFARSGSVFLALWSFFLVEALYPLLPNGDRENTAEDRQNDANGSRFEQAHRNALAALQRLNTH